MPDDSGQAPRATLPPALSVFGALMFGALAIMVVLLVLMLSSINSLEQSMERANDRLQATQDRIQDVEEEFDPLAELSPPFLRRGLPYLSATREDIQRVATRVPPMARTLDALAASVIPLADDVRHALGVVPELRVIVDAIAAAVVPLATDLQDAPVESTLVRANRALVRIDSLSLLADADRALEAVPEVRDSIDALRADILAVFCAALEHLRSLDRKTGGEAAPGDDPELEPPPEQCRARDEER